MSKSPDNNIELGRSHPQQPRAARLVVSVSEETVKCQPCPKSNLPPPLASPPPLLNRAGETTAPVDMPRRPRVSLQGEYYKIMTSI